MGQEEAPKTKSVFQEPRVEFIRIDLNDEEQEKEFCLWAACSRGKDENGTILNE